MLLLILPVLGIEFQRPLVGKASRLKVPRFCQSSNEGRQEELPEEPAQCYGTIVMIMAREGP